MLFVVQTLNFFPDSFWVREKVFMRVACLEETFLGFCVFCVQVRVSLIWWVMFRSSDNRELGVFFELNWCFK